MSGGKIICRPVITEKFLLIWPLKEELYKDEGKYKNLKAKN